MRKDTHNTFCDSSEILLVFLQLMVIVIFGLKHVLFKIFIRSYLPFSSSSIRSGYEIYKLSAGFIRKHDSMFLCFVLLI